jgi:hypothetical protein
MTSRLLLSTALVTLFLLPVAAWAQATADMNGRVTDQSGAVLPGVTITVTQTDTGLVRSVVADSDGSYVLSNLPTGPYRLEAMLQGFRSYVQTGIVLQVGGKPTINVSLAVGALEEAVTVQGAAPIVDVKSAGIREVVEQQRIVELPLQGRQVTDLIVLAGAAVNLGSPVNRSYQSGVQISVAGGLSSGVAYTLDGAIHNDTQTTDGLPLPFPDALQEFSVVTSGAPAQYGMNTGASVNAVTKSGTNMLHGNAFEFLRDARFNATNPFAGIGPDGKRLNDGLKRNQWGGTIGGPVVHDKLFFFGGLQLTPTRVRPADNIAFVPTAAMLAGDFSAITSPACNNGRQTALRAPFVNNTISPTAFSPAALNLAKRLPSTSDPCGRTTYQSVNNRDENQYVARVDYQRNANDTIFGRYLLSSDVRPAALDFSDNVLVSPTAGTRNYAQAATVGDTRILSASTVNNMRFAFNRTTINRRNKDYFQPSDLGINALQLFADERDARHGDRRVQYRGGHLHPRHRGHQHLPVQRRPDARPRAASDLAGRCPRPMALAEQHVGARRRHMDLLGNGERPGSCRLPAGQGRVARTGRRRRPDDAPVVSGLLRAGRVASVGPGDRQCRRALGAVLRPAGRGRRRDELRRQQVQGERQEPAIRQRARGHRVPLAIPDFRWAAPASSANG